ncbi:MAG: nucleoside triphosphate pyrophosphohydrolase [Anaerovoracaceae bacterium]
MMNKEEFLKNYNKDHNMSPEEAFMELTTLIEILRKECPWDKEQTHESLRQCLLEEAYEVVDAVNRKDFDNLKEELGDVLMEVVFYSLIAQEENKFDLSQVISGVTDKMVRRHPHVFSHEKADSIDNVLVKWENIKRKETEAHLVSDRLSNVPRALPALIRSYKLQERAKEAGFDWESIDGAFHKFLEELGELKEAISLKAQTEIENEMGDVLFSVVNLARFLNVNPEEALDSTSDRFIRRFSKMEELAQARSLKMEEMSFSELDGLWEEAKKVTED